VSVKSTYFEDIEVDKIRETPAITVTETHVSLYLGLTREAAASSDVPAALPLCMSIGLGWRVKEPPLAVLAFVGLDWQIVRDVRVGDTIHGRSRILSKRPMRDGGFVVDERCLIDQHGEVVQQGKFTFLVAKRKEVPA
jgi:acyl dehydratase